MTITVVDRGPNNNYKSMAGDGNRNENQQHTPTPNRTSSLISNLFSHQLVEHGWNEERICL